MSLWRWLLLGCATLIACGCASTSKPVQQQDKAAVQVQGAPDELRSTVLAATDSYVTQSTQALDELRQKTTRPQVVAWAKEQRFNNAMSAYTNATGPNPLVCAADMVILTSLRRASMERHWVPDLLHEEGAGVLASARRGEEDMWKIAERALTEEQRKELREAIDKWIEEHPDQYYVGWVRLTDFAGAKSNGGGGGGGRKPSSVFALLYLDPLTNLDPVTQELRSYRSLSERLMYLLMRLPAVWSWRVEILAANAIDTPQTNQIAAATTQFADASSRIADSVKVYPEQIAAQLNGQSQQLQALLNQSRDLLKESQTTAATVKTQADELVTSVTRSLIVLVVLVIVLPPIALFGYRLACRKWLSGTSVPHDTRVA